MNHSSFRQFSMGLASVASLTLLLTACNSPSEEQKSESPKTAVQSATPAAPKSASKSPKFEAYAELQPFVTEVAAASASIPEERKAKLEKLALFVKAKRAAGEDAKLTFICTHNSRRSHLAQIWSTTAAAYYGLNGVSTYSGGTESTAFNPRAVGGSRWG